MKLSEIVLATSLVLAPSCGNTGAVVVPTLIPTVSPMNRIEHSYILHIVQGRQSAFKIYIPTERYFKYKQMTHSSPDDAGYNAFVTYDDETIKQIASVLKYGTPEQTANRILQYVQNIPYDTESEDRISTNEYIRYPVETIVERNADCEDASILAVALMKAAGLNVALLHFDLKKDGEIAPGHVATGVEGNFQGICWKSEGVCYFMGESTGSTTGKMERPWSVGEAGEMEKKPAAVYRIK